MAKRWFDEQQPHMRQTRWTRGLNYSKSDTCTGIAEVDAADISVKVRDSSHVALPGEI